MSSSSSSSSSSEAVEGTDYHVEHFCTETDRCIPFNGIKTLYDSGTLQNGTKKPSDIVGIVNFFVRTTEPALLKYFPLEKGPDVRRFGGEYFDAYCRFRDTPEGTTEEVDVGPLYPIRTDGDGNCLLHAVSIAMWGRHDQVAGACSWGDRAGPPPALTPPFLTVIPPCHRRRKSTSIPPAAAAPSSRSVHEVSEPCCSAPSHISNAARPCA